MTQAQKRILIVDDDKALADVLARRCEALGLRAEACYDAIEAITRVVETAPDLVCLDMNMPSGNGLGICELIVNNEQLANIPVILLTGNKDEETIRRCHHLCAYYVQKHATVWNDLDPLIRELLELNESETTMNTTSQDQSSRFLLPTAGPSAEPQSEVEAPNQGTQNLVDAVFEILGADETFFNEAERDVERDSNEPPWILMIEDDRDFSAVIKMRLEQHGVQVIRSFDGTEGVRTAFAKPADAILLDFELPHGQGDYVLGRLKDNPLSQDIPVIMLTGRKDKFLERRILGMGAAAFMNKPVDMQALLSELGKHIPLQSLNTAASV